MLDKYFNKVYIITTINSERIDYCKNQMKKAGIESYEFYTAFDSNLIIKNVDNFGEEDIIPQRYISLSYSVISLLKSAINNNYDNICICEDDIFFDDNWEIKLKDFMDNIPNDWDILNLGYADATEESTNINKYVNKLWGRKYGSHCVVYKKSCYQGLINSYYKKDCNIPIDWLIIEICNNYNIYIPLEHFIFQTSKSYNGKSNLECEQLFESTINLSNRIYKKPINIMSNCVINKEHIEDFEFSFSEEKEIIIEEGCRIIGYKAFSVCDNIETIKLPESVERIEDKAFFDCKNLKEIYIGKNVKYIGVGVFKGCINLQKIEISSDNNFYTIKDGSLYTKNLDTLLFYPTVKRDILFETLPETKTIEQYAFSDNPFIENLILNTSIENVNSFDFNNCEKLNTLIILSNVNTIADNIYNNCNNLKNIYCFNDYKLSMILGLTDIDRLFVSGNIIINLNDWQLENYGILKDVKSINNNIKFLLSDNYVFENNSILSADKTILYRVLPNTYCDEYVCPSTIKTIYRWAFKHCKGIKNIKLNDGLEVIKVGAFENCSFEKIIIPDTVIDIQDFAFTWCYNLKKIILNDGIKYIGDAVFKECKQLNNIIIPTSVEWCGKHLFECCDNLSSLVITEKLYNSIENIFKDSTCNPKMTYWNVG